TFDALPFANFVSIVPNITPESLKLLLERAVAGAPAEAGQFAQVAGMRFTFDPSQPAFALTGSYADGTAVVSNTGSRIREVQLNDGTFMVQNGQVVPTAPTIAIATI